MKPIRVWSESDELAPLGPMVALSFAFDRETNKFHALVVDSSGDLHAVHAEDLLVHPKDTKRVWKEAKKASA